MLALTRRVGEEIVIGPIENPLGFIRVVEVHGDKTRIALDFTKGTQLTRLELANNMRLAKGMDQIKALPDGHVPGPRDFTTKKDA